MELNTPSLQGVWETLAQEDPLWAILSAPEKKGGKWDLAEFFQTGVVEIHDLIQELAHHEIAFSTDAALDFGCGVGRLSQALVPYFHSVSGVDVAPTMIRRAQELNKHPDKCRYFLNASEDLALFETEQFSFIYSNIVLQHVPPELARKYLAEFIRILRPDGLLVFQLPARFIQEEELPAAAFQARIACPDEQLSLLTNAHATVRVSVENMSPHPWKHHLPFSIALGNHWLRLDGSLLTQDDGRTLLPDGLMPNETIDLLLEIRAPAAPGNYLLELDLVQEGVAWFGGYGSETVRMETTITPQEDTAEPTPSSLATEAIQAPAESQDDLHFGMHCIPRKEVTDLIFELGCKLEFIETSGSGGRGTMSYVYYARKCS